MRPSEKIALKILNILHNDDIFRKMNPFEWKVNYDSESPTRFEESDLSPFESHIHDVIEDIGINSYWYKKGPIPFKLSIYSHSEEQANFYPLFSGISEGQKKITEMNLKCLKNFTRLFDKKVLFIINNDTKVSEAIKKNLIPIVKIKDLENIDDEEEFIELIQGSGTNI
jgi:predicted transcriptional regulator